MEHTQQPNKDGSVPRLSSPGLYIWRDRGTQLTNGVSISKGTDLEMDSWKKVKHRVQPCANYIGHVAPPREHQNELCSSFHETRELAKKSFRSSSQVVRYTSQVMIRPSHGQENDRSRWLVTVKSIEAVENEKYKFDLRHINQSLWQRGIGEWWWTWLKKMELSRKRHAIERSVYLWCYAKWWVWLHTPQACNHQSFAWCPSYSLDVRLLWWYFVRCLHSRPLLKFYDIAFDVLPHSHVTITSLI